MGPPGLPGPANSGDGDVVYIPGPPGPKGAKGEVGRNGVNGPQKGWNLVSFFLHFISL